jgi:hypothetical protein
MRRFAGNEFRKAREKKCPCHKDCDKQGGAVLMEKTARQAHKERTMQEKQRC